MIVTFLSLLLTRLCFQIFYIYLEYLYYIIIPILYYLEYIYLESEQIEMCGKDDQLRQPQMHRDKDCRAMITCTELLLNHHHHHINEKTSNARHWPLPSVTTTGPARNRQFCFTS